MTEAAYVTHRGGGRAWRAPWELAPNARRYFGGGGSAGTPQPTPAPPRKSDAEVQAERSRQRNQARLRKGRAATMLTQGGINSEEETPGQSRTLLGGGAA